MVFLWGLWLLCLPALHGHLGFVSAHAIEQKRLFLDKDGELKDLKSAGIVQAALPGDIATLPNTELVDFTYDSFQEIDGPMSRFTTTPPDMRDDWSPEDEAIAGAEGCPEQQPSGEIPSSEEEGEAGHENCEMRWKKSHRLADGLMRFSIDLLREVQLESNRSNVILSPLSIALALSHLALGAANQTEKHLLEAMHLGSVPCLHHMLGALRRRLTASTLSLASRLYLQKGFEVKEKFLEDSEKFYGAKPMTLSGMSADDLAAINKWVKEATNGQIPTFLQQLPENTVMLLLNAIHFQGSQTVAHHRYLNQVTGNSLHPDHRARRQLLWISDCNTVVRHTFLFEFPEGWAWKHRPNIYSWGFWRNKFDVSFTGTDVFHLDNEFVVPVEMMKAQKYSLSWFTLESQDIQVAKFPFKSNMSFVAIVPNQYTWNTSHVLENFPYKQLCKLFPQEVPTTVKVPKVKLDYQLELNKVLSQMGLQELFTSPDLQKITDDPLIVSSIQHQSTLELKEDGVEASGATGVAISRSFSAFSLDRPFVFIMFEDETGIPLFIGSVQNPNPNAAPQIKAPRDSHEATNVNEYPVPK